MKPLTKTAVNRGGGIAARFAPAASPPPKPIPAPKSILTKLAEEVSAMVDPKPSAKVKASRAKTSRYKEYQRAYMKDYRAKRRAAKNA